MAQRTEKEETEFKVPETLTHCVNNCGIMGNPSTNNFPRSTSSFNFEAPAETLRKTTASEITRSDESLNRRVVNRCSGCWRKVWLTGFRFHLAILSILSIISQYISQIMY
ncbi:unnamed protein product [Malus baccata var. baccata]